VILQMQLRRGFGSAKLVADVKRLKAGEPHDRAVSVDGPL